MPRLDTEDYKKIFINDIPIMDVRAPVEFNKGSFPSAKNVLILDDKQREQVGTIYKNEGREAAFGFALKLATPEIRAERLEKWQDFCRENPSGFLFCFRGGYRSQTTQKWLHESGIDYPLVKGGYKALRRFLIDDFKNNLDSVPTCLVGGSTGTGKTRLLYQIDNMIDLEGLANHRGSAFGRKYNDDQPVQINFENELYIEFLKYREKMPGRMMFLEDEGRMIGRVCLPDVLAAKMKTLPLAILDEPVEYRINIIIEDYIERVWPDYENYFGNDAKVKFEEYVLGSLFKIKRRLGGVRHKEIHESFTKALELFFRKNDSSGFEAGISSLLIDYYDPMYEYQLSKKNERIIFKGSTKELVEFAKSK